MNIQIWAIVVTNDFKILEWGCSPEKHPHCRFAVPSEPVEQREQGLLCAHADCGTSHQECTWSVRHTKKQEAGTSCELFPIQVFEQEIWKPSILRTNVLIQ
ncbi:hypothetical protein DV515_00016434 [Chloebia gouldiae]|uniref:Uncharacterized protein n=1 Tax=Chloebia gouldiae TaxID=44316 RepID=A0A3L8RS76_CHLGU|nr:hypothetical protein DV515_00016434 [Chloebia gouldiae]